MKAKELAKKLGVSPATISLVLNNKPGISDSLRHSLIEKIQDLGCSGMLCFSNGEGGKKEMDPPGKMRSNIAYLIYTACDENSDRFAFFPAVLEGAEMEAREYGYNLVVLHMKCNGNAELRYLLEDGGETIGAIIQARNISDAILDDVRQLNIPYVFVDCYLPEQNVSSVCVNNEQGIFSAVRYLKEMGHTQLGYVSSGADSDSMIERRRSFHQALREYDLEDNRSHYYVSNGQNTEAFEKLCQIWKDAKEIPTALMAESDILAWRVIKALEHSGFRVPEDVSVVGFDDRSICTMIEPNLTTVKNYRHLMGRECIMALKNLKRMQELGIKLPSLKVELPTELIERDSVKCLK